MSEYSDRIAEEQLYLDGLFARLDAEVEVAQERLRRVSLHENPSTPDAEALIQRETDYHALNEKLNQLNLASIGLLFGRIDIVDNPDRIDNPVPGRENLDRRYIGRMGITAREEGYRSLLLDWRAPLARPFYLATTARPDGVELRRHIRTTGRTVTSIDDEHLSGSGSTDRTGIAGESALLRSVMSARGAHMRSIVETIQAEQDAIITDATRGLMIVEGGPGTGKTAVALHRVAWLLYTWRDELAKTGVLIIGPNRTFLDYISQVLPELGETGVVLSTIGELYPGMTPAEAPEPLLVQEIKGSAEMSTILQRLVKHHQRVPNSDVPIQVEGVSLVITPAMVKAARTRARRSRKPHNVARGVFIEAFLDALADHFAERIGGDPLGGKNLLSRADVDELHDDLAHDPGVMDLIDSWWPVVEPQTMLREFFSDRQLIDSVAADYDDETRDALGWSTQFHSSDAALLDELAYLVGMPDPEQARADAEAAWRTQVEEAQDALDILASSASLDSDDEVEAEILEAHDIIDAETLARRQEARDLRTTAERAREDYTWAYGHIIVDEAQELSPMQWRMVMRRSPNRWLTLVGDTAQTGSPAGVDSWSEALEPFVGTRFRRHSLSVNYRTPAPITELANRILEIIDPGAEPVSSIRDGEPVRMMESGDPEAVGAQLKTADPARSVAIIDARTVAQVKGLEFDHVIVVDPTGIVEASPQGWQDLYVAVTRATQSLTVIGPLPFSTFPQ